MDMDGYEVTYEGPCTELAASGALVDADSLLKLEDGYNALALGQLEYKGIEYGKKGDTVAIRPENTYYKVVCNDTAQKASFVLYPRAQANPSMGLLASPDIFTTAGFDLYTHISSIPNPEDKHKEPETPQTQLEVAPGKIFFANDYVCKITEIHAINAVAELPGTKFDAGIVATIEIQGPEKTYQAKPRYVIKGNQAGRLFSDVKALGLRFEVVSINPTTGSLKIGYHATEPDWIIFKAIRKPFIALVWGGFMVMMLGFGLALTGRKKTAKPLEKASKSLKEEAIL